MYSSCRVARFLKELALPPKLRYQAMGPSVFESDDESGEHFGAFGRPGALIEDLGKIFGIGRGGLRVVKGCSSFDEQKGRVSSGKSMMYCSWEGMILDMDQQPACTLLSCPDVEANEVNSPPRRMPWLQCGCSAGWDGEDRQDIPTRAIY